MGFDSRLNFNNPNLFIDLIRMRQEKQQDSIIIIVGQKRTGKSVGAIKIAETIDPNFNVEEGLFFEPSPFLKYFNSAYDKVIIFDEGSESYDRRSWWEIQNRVFNSLLTREGFRRHVLIITLPVLSDLDARAVRLSSFLVTMYGFNVEKKFSIGDVYRLKLAHLLGKTMPMHVQTLKLNLPSATNLDKYGKMKVDWNAIKSQQNIDILEQLENPESLGKKFNWNFYVNAYRQDAMDEIDLRNHLLELGYNKPDVTLLVENEFKRKELIEKELEKKLEEEARKKAFLDSLGGNKF